VFLCLKSRTNPALAVQLATLIRNYTGVATFCKEWTYLWPDLTKPTIGHLCHKYFSLDWNRNITTIMNTKGASAKVSDGGFCQIGSHLSFLVYVSCFHTSGMFAPVCTLFIPLGENFNHQHSGKRIKRYSFFIGPWILLFYTARKFTLKFNEESVTSGQCEAKTIQATFGLDTTYGLDTVVAR